MLHYVHLLLINFAGSVKWVYQRFFTETRLMRAMIVNQTSNSSLSSSFHITCCLYKCIDKSSFIFLVHSVYYRSYKVNVSWGGKTFYLQRPFSIHTSCKLVDVLVGKSIICVVNQQQKHLQPLQLYLHQFILFTTLWNTKVTSAFTALPVILNICRQWRYYACYFLWIR